MNNFPEQFDHAAREPEIYAAWEAARAFHADGGSAKKPYFIAMPPPNATGPLHIGHALTLTIEDVIVRWRRMAGDEVLWLPGTDHASISTERTVIRLLETAKEPVHDPRRTLGRDGLLEKITAHVEAHRVKIRAQIKALGASCDWSRERYTLDPTMRRIVDETFGRMFHDGLIYRGNRIVNWDFDLGTTLSEDEIHTEERDAPLYFIQYGELPVATYRPEMRLGDTALAVHPEDEKYRKYIGKDIEVPWPKGPKIRVKVVADSMVDRYFGLGVVGVTPAHDPNDFELAKRHGLPLVTIIGSDGRMTGAAGPYAGLTPMKCREALINDLRDAQLLIYEKKGGKPQQVRYSSRGGTPVEYLPRKQWFVDVNRPALQWQGQTMSLRQVMEAVVQPGKIRFLQEAQKENYLRWINKLRDWGISRQVWWGHRVPVWYRRGSETYVGAHPPGEDWIQDPDTLDTWFSSAMWSWSTLIDPTAAQDPTLTLNQILERSPDYHRFHPMAVLETGYDILFFWVARMILMTTYMTGELPFKKVYLHGLVLDEKRRRMSTARPESCIDPQVAIAEYGADALRLALIGRTSMAVNTQLTDEKLSIAHRFIVKVWNAARYVLTRACFDDSSPVGLVHPVNRWMRSRLDDTVAGVTGALDTFEVTQAAKIAQDGFRTDFCDLYIGATKTKELGGLGETQHLLDYSLATYLCVLHPFIPLVTEALWGHSGNKGLLMQRAWPSAGTPEDTGVIAGVDALFRLMKWIRKQRSQDELLRRGPVDLRVWAAGDRQVLESCNALLKEMVNVGSIEFADSKFDGDVVLDDRLIVTSAPSSKS